MTAAHVSLIISHVELRGSQLTALCRHESPGGIANFGSMAEQCVFELAIAVPKQQTVLSNHPSFENGAAVKAALGPVIARAAVVPSVRSGDRSSRLRVRFLGRRAGQRVHAFHVPTRVQQGYELYHD